MAKKKVQIKWLSEPEAHSYPAAQSYLSLLYKDSVTHSCVEKLKNASMTKYKAKDIFRASGLSLLGVSNAHVERDQEKIASGEALSPLLLVRDATLGKVVIADGYHRLCAIYPYDEDAVVPCKIV
jgi:disulfide oxidoreductase YuzD